MDRPTFDSEGRYIYYASELGSCSKYLVAKRLGKVEKEGGKGSDPEYLPRIFAEGHLHEGAVLGKLKEDGWSVFGEQDQVQLEVGVEGTVIVGHLDAKGTSPDRKKVVIEVKSMGAESFKTLKRLGWDSPGLVQKYKWQLSVYCFASELPGVLVVKNRNDGEILFLWMDKLFYTYDDFQQRVLEIETQAEVGELPVECDMPMWPCPFEYLHEETKTIRKDLEVDTWARAYQEASREIKRLEEVKAEARGKLDEMLGDTKILETVTGTRVSRWGGEKVTYNWEGMVNELTWNLSESEFAEFMGRFKKVSEYRSIRVTIKGEDGTDQA